MATSRDERTALRAAMAAATARPWDTVQMTEDRDGCAVMAGHDHEGFVADTMFSPNATAIKLAANLAERLCDDVDQLSEVNDLINAERDRAFVLVADLLKGLRVLRTMCDTVPLPAGVEAADALIARGETIMPTGSHRA